MFIQILIDGQICHQVSIEGPVEIGRQNVGEPEPFHSFPSEGRTRLVIAPYHKTSVSRSNLVLEPLSNDRVRLTNTSSAVPITLGLRNKLVPWEETIKNLPVTLIIGHVHLKLSAEPIEESKPLPTHQPILTTPESQNESANIQQLPFRDDVPSYEESLTSLLHSRDLLEKRDTLDWNQVVAWLRSAVKVLQIAATSDQFFETAARAAIGLVDLDSARVLVVKDDDWQVKALSMREEDDHIPNWRASTHVLDRVRAEKTTFWVTPDELGERIESLLGVSSVVAAPILNEHGEVTAVLYGDRKLNYSSAGQDNLLTELDATLMELLAFGISSGLNRLKQERTALAAQTRFEEFFTPRLSKRLMNDDSLLKGQEREITLLFCDLRRFSQFTEQFGHTLTVSWLNDVLGVISEAILERDGVLVDYSGDQVMAMWGAPEELNDHPTRACEAAISILEQLPELNERWSEKLNGEQVDVGIGIDTGRAFVGNIGSHRKFKYGALGNAVNQASRIQGATKYLQSRLLISSSTRDALPELIIDRQTRCVGRAHVQNIEEPITLHELVPLGIHRFRTQKSLLESCVEQLKQGDEENARTRLETLLKECPEDALAKSFLQQLTPGPDYHSLLKENGEWVLTGK